MRTNSTRRENALIQGTTNEGKTFSPHSDIPVKVKEYSWSAGRRISVDAQVVGPILEELSEKHGAALTPESVVAEAKKKASPLHKAFEWDDSAAAHEYRLDQARLLIRSLRVSVQVEQTQEMEPRRVFVHVATRSEEQEEEPIVRRYEPIMVALKNPTSRDYILATAKAELFAFRRKYAELTELAKVFVAIDSLEDAA